MAKLAIDGGSPIRDEMLPYGQHWIDDQDIESVIKVLRSKWITTGPKVSEFEEAFADFVGAKFAVAVSNGTAALHAAIFASEIGSGDEVIVTPMTFVATANSIRYQGGTVVFADVRPDSLNLDPEEVRETITHQTRGIVAVDYAGQPSDLDEINKIADEFGLIVIEDASHALGATYCGRKVGSVSHLTTFSLHPVKIITAGEGGVITTDDVSMARKLRRFRNHGIDQDLRQREFLNSWFYEMVELGYNYRLTDFQCALAYSQLSRIEKFLVRRREIAEQYSAAFTCLPEIEIPLTLSDRESAWHLYVVRLKLDRLRVNRLQIFKALRAENIGVNVHYIPVHLHPYYRRLGYLRGSLPVAEEAYESIISLPIFPKMSDEDINDVISACIKVITAYRV